MTRLQPRLDGGRILERATPSILSLRPHPTLDPALSHGVLTCEVEWAYTDAVRRNADRLVDDSIDAIRRTLAWTMVLDLGGALRDRQARGTVVSAWADETRGGRVRRIAAKVGRAA